MGICSTPLTSAALTWDDSAFSGNLANGDDTLQEIFDKLDALVLGGTPEGTAILSTGEAGGTKFLREDGDGTCSWQDATSSILPLVLGTNLVEQYNSTNAQTFNLYGTTDGGANYERLALSADGAGTMTLAAETGGTGTDNCDIVLTPAGAGDVILNSGNLDFTGSQYITRAGALVVQFQSSEIITKMNVKITGQIFPNVDSSYSCGDNTRAWSRVHADTVQFGISTAPKLNFVDTSTINLTEADGTTPGTLDAGDIALDQTTADNGFINFKATADADATSAISTLTTSGATTHHIQIEINGVTAWIACSTTDPT